MKKVLLIIVSVLLTVNSFAQEHLKFKGKSMDCSCREMQHYLTEQGFKTDSYEDGVWLMTGKFAGSEALLIINPSPNGKVSSVIVVYDVEDWSWKIVKGKLETYEEMLTKKYGKPKMSKKDLDVGYRDGSGMELLGFRYGSSEYTLGWDVDGGAIGLALLSEGGKTAISILYLDNINSDVEEQEAYDDL